MVVKLARMTGMAARSSSASAKLKKQKQIEEAETVKQPRNTPSGQGGMHLLSQGPWKVKDFLGRPAPPSPQPRPSWREFMFRDE